MVGKFCLAVMLLAHSWYPPECCGGGDCHPVPCSEITEGWAEGSLQWHKRTVMPGAIRESQDDQCHACAREQGPDWKYNQTFCLFLPRKTS